MLVDFHSHCLAGIDDGAESTEISVGIIHRTKQQGVDIIVATPHFFAYKESVGAFLKRRQAALDQLSRRLDGGQMPHICPGAEVALQRDLSLVEGIDSLCFGPSRYMLLELPLSNLKDWMIQEIQNIAYRYSVTPVLAHLERYFFIYKRDDMERILGLKDCVFQLNNRALFSAKTLRFAMYCIKRGLPVVFGSDAHDLSSRAPDFDRAVKIAAKKKFDLCRTGCFAPSIT